jgi:hypothetical protein
MCVCAVCCGAALSMICFGIPASQALLSAKKTLQSRLTRHEFLDFCRRSHVIRTWVNYYDDPRDAMDVTDIGGDAGGAVFPVFGFSGMAKDDEAILQIREEGVVRAWDV